jgi:hypothetical protein
VPIRFLSFTDDENVEAGRLSVQVELTYNLLLVHQANEGPQERRTPCVLMALKEGVQVLMQQLSSNSSGPITPRHLPSNEVSII